MMREDRRLRSGFDRKGRGDDLRDWLKRDDRSERSGFRNEGRRDKRNRRRKSSSPNVREGRFSPPDNSRFKRSRSPQSRDRGSRNRSGERWRSLSREREKFDSASKFSPPRYFRRSMSRDNPEIANKNKFSPPHYVENLQYFDFPQKDSQSNHEPDEYYERHEPMFKERRDIMLEEPVPRDDFQFPHDRRDSFRENQDQLSRNLFGNQSGAADQFRENIGTRMPVEMEKQHQFDDIPEFNPETSNISAISWLKIVERVAEMNKWQNDEKRFNMSSKLAGFARQWYLSTGKNIARWRDLKFKFLQSFPSEMDYCNNLIEMLKRKKQIDESMVSYFDHKVALLNVCDIIGAKAVSCIIDGLPDDKLKREAKGEDFTNIGSLLEFLRGKELEKDNIMQPQQQQQQKPSKEDNSIVCFKCRKPGHKKKDCKIMNTCSYCHKKGHFEAECKYKNEDEAVSRSHNKVMFGALANTPTYPQYFKDVEINGNRAKGYVDFSSEAVTIREDTANKLGLMYQKMYKVVRSFGGTLVSCVGEFEGVFSVDEVFAKSKAYIVPDHIQAVEIILGKEFTKQPHILISTDNGAIHLKHKPGVQQQPFYTTTNVQAASYYY